MGENMGVRKEKKAVLKLVLKRDTGYSSTEEMRVSPKQWGKIMVEIRKILKE